MIVTEIIIINHISLTSRFFTIEIHQMYTYILKPSRRSSLNCIYLFFILIYIVPVVFFDNKTSFPIKYVQFFFILPATFLSIVFIARFIANSVRYRNNSLVFELFARLTSVCNSRNFDVVFLMRKFISRFPR